MVILDMRSPTLSSASPAGAWPARAALREATRVAHDAVDRAFGQFDLGEAGSYGDALTAHARALPAIEDWLDRNASGRLRAVRGAQRGSALRRDLAALDRPVPTPGLFNLPTDEATATGVAYVLEGSRLGATMLARSVPPHLPCSFLGDASDPQRWQAFLAVLPILLPDDEALERAGAGAMATFEFYRNAATDQGA